MPTIPAPTEQSVLPEGQLAYQSSAGATPDAFGGSIGQAAQQAGTDADQIATRQFAIKNESDTVAAQNDLMSRIQDLQNGNKDAGIVGYRTLVGQNAVDALPDYQQKLQDAYKQVRGNLNPAAARQFDFMGTRILRGSMDSMGGYSAQQQVVGLHQNTRAQVQLAQQGALTYADDPGGWDTHIAAIQEASLAGSRQLGLGTDATEMQRQRDVSQAFQERTKQLMIRDPMEAADFYHQNIGSIVPDQRYPIEHALKVTTDGQYAHGDGMTAYQTAIGKTSAPALPADVGAPDVKPFDPKRIGQVTSFVKSPTPWDADIATAAKQYNVNPDEIKLKIAIESQGNPKAVNPASGTTGLGQFTADTAARFGVTDRTDPVQSINGIAKMLAASGGTVGGDMSKADRAYFGGNPNAKGPNTDQYVENTRAARQALMGGGAPAPLSIAEMTGKEGDVVASAQALAEQRRPGDQNYADQVTNQARRQWGLDLQSMKGVEYQNYSNIMGSSTGDNGARALTDLPADQQQLFASLDPQHQESLMRLWQMGAARDAKGDTQVTPENTRSYLALSGQAMSDPVAFKNRDIAADIADLPRPFQAHILNLFTGIDKATAQGASYSKALGDPGIVKMLESAKIAIPSATQKRNTDDYNVFAGRLRDALDTFMGANKRNPTQKELLQMGGSLMTPGKVAGSGTFWDDSSPAFKADPSKFYVPLPGGDQGKQLASSFEKVMGHTPTQPELQQWYTRYKLGGGQ